MKKMVCFVLAMLLALPVLPAFAENVSTLVVENPSNVNVLLPLSLTLTVADGFENAEIYIDDTKIDSITADGSTTYARAIDVSGMTYLGDATVKAVVNYAATSETLTQAITMTKVALTSTELYSQDFSGFDGSSATMPFLFTANNAGKYDLYTDGTNPALRVTYTGNGAFFNRSGMGLEKGAVFTLEFDLMFDNNTENPPENEVPNAALNLELRDYGKHPYGYPYNGNTTKSGINIVGKGGIVCKGEEGSVNNQIYTQQWYQFRLVINSISKGVQVYMKKAEETEWVLQADMPNYGFVGFKEFRFTGYHQQGNDSIIYDNIKLYEKRAANVWYAKPAFADESGSPVSALPISGGKIQLNFSKDMGAIDEGVVSLTNSNGEEIPFTGVYDPATFVYTMSPTQTLRYGGEYQVKLASGTKAADNASALTEQPIAVTTEKYPVHVVSAKATGGTVSVQVEDAAEAGETMMVCRYDKGKLVAVNSVALSAGQGAYTVTLDNTDTDLETKVYILDGFSTMNVMDTYLVGGGSGAVATALIYPPESHPRVYLNTETIAYLQANKDSEVYASNFNYLLSLAQKDLPEVPADKALSSSISNRLVVRALMYALGEVDESHARETVEFALSYLNAPVSNSTGSINIYKDFGINGIQAGALVYDWCYDVMTDAERTQLAGFIRDMMYSKDQPCRPNNVKTGWSDIAGKAVGQPLVYNSIAAVAIYDKHPEIYEAIMPKIQGTMADIVREFGQAGALTDGSIAYTREYYSYYVALLFERMGYPNFYGDQSKVGYKMLYARLPYGAMMKQGDDFYQTNYKMGSYNNGYAVNQNLAFLSVMENDPYLRFQYMKENPSARGWEALLLTEADVETKLPDDLPLAYYISEPKSEILARTSWQDGLDSPAVSALMSIHNRRTGDHDHGNIGEFQLYYKGPLTMPGGMYEGTNSSWGSAHWREYYTRSVSSNCMTVYDPNEKVAWHNKVAEANDGGQRMVTPKAQDGTIVISDYDEQMSDDNIWATTDAHYIGPNEKTPAFSYIKGDITNAYSKDKMQSYKRGMVFMDTFNPTYPGVMVVYDRVVSKDASFKKKWLLQSVTEPTVDENKITIVNTEDGANGKLVNTTLLPGEVDIETVGEVGKYIVEGKEYPTSSSASDVYKGGIRLEVSPKEAKKEDIFLNAMYVTDANGNAPELPMIKEETDKFVGVTTLDRTVLFSKSGKRVNEEFEFTVRENGFDEMLCFITDIEAGNWCIENETGTAVIAADKNGYSLTFSARPGTYRIYPTNDAAVAQNFVEAKKEKIGDFTVKLDGAYTYVKSPNKTVSGLPYFAVADFMERYLDAETSQNGTSLTVTLADGATVTLTAGSTRYTYAKDGSTRTGEMEAAALMENGVMYITPKTVAKDLGLNATWTPRIKALKFTKR